MTAIRRAEIDPRIRQRRIEVRRASGRKRLRRVLALAVVLAIGLAGVLASLSPLMDVDRIAVAGATATPQSEITAASGLSVGDPMVRIDVDAATAALEALPWVDSAVVRRDFPSAVKIEITERQPIGIVRSGETEALVDATGRVLGAVQFGFGDLPRMEISRALPAPGERLGDDSQTMLDLTAIVGSGIDGHTVVVVEGPDGEASLTVDETISVRLGDGERMATKVRSTATLLDQVDLTCVDAIDVRIADLPVLTRDESCL